MGLVQEFKEFAMKGNVVDMAVGLVIGAAFGKIVTSLVNDIIMPPIGLLIADQPFTKYGVELRPAVGDKEAIVIHAGAFINTVVDFLIVAVSIFLVIKAMNMLRRRQKKQEAAAPAPPRQEVLLTEIRDLLKQRG